MATYDGSRYLDEQLRSIRGQSVLPDEVVVADDCSRDDTVEICREFARTAPFDVRLLQNERTLGYARNFGVALSACSGDLVLLADQDDVWYPNKIERVMHAYASDPGAHLWIHDLAFCDEDLRRTGDTKLRRVRAMADPRVYYVTGMATAISGEFLRACLPIPPAPLVTHDDWLHACAHYLGGKRIVDEVLADYRRHGKNATGGSLLNVGEAPSVTSVLREQAGAADSGGVRRREQTLSSLADRLGTVDGPLRSFAGNEGHLVEIIKRVDKDLRSTKQRLALLSTDRLSRLVPAIALYARGGYAGFNGARSLLKDLLRRASRFHGP